MHGFITLAFDAAYQRARAPKELHWIERASQVDLYDKDEYVPGVVAKLDELHHAGLMRSVAG